MNHCNDPILDVMKRLLLSRATYKVCKDGLVALVLLIDLTMSEEVSTVEVTCAQHALPRL